MNLPQRRWDEIKKRLSQDDQVAVICAKTGIMAIGAGIVIDEKRLAPELRIKLMEPVAFPARIARAAS
jgi:hypothetical protein